METEGREPQEGRTHCADNGPDRIPGVDAGAGGGRVGLAAGQGAHREREARAHEGGARHQYEAGEDRVGSQPALASRSQGEGQPGQGVDPQEAQIRRSRGAHLRQRKLAGGGRGIAGSPGRQCTSQHDARQKTRQHGGEGVDGAPEQVAEQARPEHFIAERRDSGDGHQGQDPGGRRGTGRARGGLSRRRFQGREPPRSKHRHGEDQRVGRDTDPHGALQPHGGQQHECGNQRAGHGARGVEGVEQSDPGPDLVRAPHGRARQQGKRRPHEGRGQHQDREGGSEVEEGEPQAPGFGQVGGVSEPGHFEGGAGAHCDGHTQGGDADGQLEDPVEPQRPEHPLDPAPCDRCAQGQPAHVGAQHRRHGRLGGAEHEAELTHPDRLVEEGGEARQPEADEHHVEGKIVGFIPRSCRDLGSVHALGFHPHSISTPGRRDLRRAGADRTLRSGPTISLGSSPTAMLPIQIAPPPGTRFP